MQSASLDAESVPLNPDDVVMQKTPFSFDVSVWELFWPFQVGAGLIIAKPNGHRDPDYLLGVIARYKVTTLHFVPSMLQAFMDAKPEDSGHLRQVFCSGEALSQPLIDGAKSKFSAAFHNLYGPTEAAVDVTWWPLCRTLTRRISADRQAHRQHHHLYR